MGGPSPRRIGTGALALALALVASGPVFAARSHRAPGHSTPAQPGAEDRYQACLDQAGARPAQALEQAQAWEGQGGGLAARHCQALALVGLKRYAEAAARLEEIARQPALKPDTMRGALLDQAGNAWILANEPKKAYAALDAALKLSPDSAELFIDRARARALTRDWRGAVMDLSTALSLDPAREEAYVFRASALRQAGDLKRALEDVETALALNEKDADALLERGAIRAGLGNADGARQDWTKAAQVAPDSPAGQAARSNLQALDGGGPGTPPGS